MSSFAPKREITVLYFAAAQTATGISSETIALPTTGSSSTSDKASDFPLSALGPLLIARHPGTKLDAVLASSQWSVDAEMVEEPEKVVLKGGEEVAVICPVSGG